MLCKGESLISHNKGTLFSTILHQSSLTNCLHPAQGGKFKKYSTSNFQ